MHNLASLGVSRGNQFGVWALSICLLNLIRPDMVNPILEIQESDLHLGTSNWISALKICIDTCTVIVHTLNSKG